MRSLPPPWISNVSPKYFWLSTEHSICQPFFNKGRDQPNLFRDMLRGFGLHRRFFQTQAPHIDVKFTNIFLRDGFVIHALLIGPLDDLVINIREVSNKGHLIATVSKIAMNDIEDDCRPSVPDVAEV